MHIPHIGCANPTTAVSPALAQNPVSAVAMADTETDPSR